MNAGHPAPGSPVGSAVGHWKFDEGYGDTANDSGTGGQNGNLGGATACPGGASCPTWTADGRFGKALSFDGSDDYVAIADTNNSLDFGTDDFTWSLWVKTTQSCSGNKVYLGRYEGLNNVSPWLGCSDSSGAGKAIFSLRDSANVSASVTGTTTINDGNWHHLVGVKSGLSPSTVKIYVNGQLENTTTANFTGNFNGTVDFVIGGNFASSYYAQAIIDEVKIYKMALTNEQVNVEYAGGFAASWEPWAQPPPVLPQTPQQTPTVPPANLPPASGLWLSGSLMKIQEFMHMMLQETTTQVL
jgi:hypothetical protein